MNSMPAFTHRIPRTRHEERGEYEAPFTVTSYICNSTSVPITVLNRINLPITYPPISGGNMGDNALSVRVIYRFRKFETIVNTINNIQKFLGVYGVVGPEIDFIVTALLNACNNKVVNCQCVDVALEYMYTYAELQEKKKLYCPTTDLFMALGNYHTELVHPFSTEGFAFSEYYNFVETKEISGIFIELIDNDSEINDRFLFAGKQVIKIPVKNDPLRISGVYYSIASSSKLNDVHIAPTHLTFKDAEDKLGLYKSQEEALSGGNPELLVKYNLQKLDSEIENLKRDNLRLKEEYRIIGTKRTEELEKVKHEYEIIELALKTKVTELGSQLEASKQHGTMLAEQLKARSTVRQDYYEERSTVRKDNSDIIKTAAVCVTAAIGIFALYAKSK